MPRITNWLEVERRLANYNTSIKTIETSLVKTNNSRNIMLHALLINLKDLLENQSEISLWFYDIDEPTKDNLPYTSWSTPSDHYGDIFYSRTKGVIYQFKTNGEWERLNDATLLNSMALTNSKLESGDHERQVFTTEPTPPYESGDWWIQNDGTLFICQIGRQTGTRQPNDFINSLDYAEAIAKATDNILEVLKGTVIQTTDNAVTYLDKATNTTTTISGNSIKTGELISNNYLSGVRGTRISLDDGRIDTNNLTINSSTIEEILEDRPTTAQMNTAISTTAQGLDVKISKKIGSSEVVTSINGSSDKLSLSTGRLDVNSNNNGIYDYNNFDLRIVQAIIMDWITVSSAISDILDANESGSITASDFTTIRNIINGSTTNTKNVSGTFKIDTQKPKNCISITKDGTTIVSIGVGGVNTELLTAENIVCGYLPSNQSSFKGVMIDGRNSAIKIISGSNEKIEIDTSGIDMHSNTISNAKLSSPTITSPSISNGSASGTSITNSTITGGTIYFDSNKNVKTVNYSNGAAIRVNSGEFCIEKSNGNSIIEFPSNGDKIEVFSEIRMYAPIQLNSYGLWEDDNTCHINSDIRLKKNIRNVDISLLEKINKLEVKEFDWKENGKHVNAGFIAQEMKNIFPDLVKENPFKKEIDGKMVNTLGIAQEGLIPYLVKAIQELSEENTKLKSIIDKQQSMIDFLFKKLSLNYEEEKDV